MTKKPGWGEWNAGDPIEDVTRETEHMLKVAGIEHKFCDIDMERWKDEKYADLLTGTLWQFPSRDKSHGHDGSYHGLFIPQVVNQVLRRYTHAGDLVLDLFIGSGTTAIEAKHLGRQCIGVDIQLKLTKQLNQQFEDVPGFLFIQADSTSPALGQRLKSLMWKKHTDLVMLHPPYWKIVTFSDDASDMSNAPTLSTFVHKFYDVARNAYQLLAPGRFACLVIGDMYADGEVIPLSYLCMSQMYKAGFSLKAINVKDIHGNEKGKGKDGPLWRYRALKFGFQVFEHEYVMIFEKRKKGRSLCADILE